MHLPFTRHEQLSFRMRLRVQQYQPWSAAKIKLTADHHELQSGASLMAFLTSDEPTTREDSQTYHPEAFKYFKKQLKGTGGGWRDRERKITDGWEIVVVLEVEYDPKTKTVHLTAPRDRHLNLRFSSFPGHYYHPILHNLLLRELLQRNLIPASELEEVKLALFR